MDFLTILKNLEEVIFEATSWLLFYPLTLWRIVRRPLGTMAYSDQEQTKDEDQRYDGALSPPLLLLTTVVIANLIGATAHVPPPPDSSDLLKTLTASQQNLILFRSLVFSLVPLIAAATLLRRKGLTMGRNTLRAPFYAQCYLASPCAVLVSAGWIFLQRADMAQVLGMVAIGGATIWFLVAQIRWFRQQLSVSWFNAGVTALWAMLRAFAYLIVMLIPIALI